MRRSDLRPALVLAGIVAAGCIAGATHGPAYALLVALAAAASWRGAPIVCTLAARWGATVAPGGRSVHARSTPLLGGLAVAAPLVPALLAAGDARAASLAAAVALLVAAGAWDDLRGLRPSTKLLVQALAAVVLFWGGHGIPALHLPPFDPIELGAAQLPFLVLWIVLVTNAVNLIDGIDGLAAGVTLVAVLACVAVGYGGAAGVVLAGALLGFLRHNLPEARLFLGDAGSLPLGLLLGAMLLADPAGLNLTVALGVVALPFGDIALCTVRRWLRGKPIFAADRRHVHHVLLRSWSRTAPVLMVLFAFTAVQALVAVAFPTVYGLGMIGAIWAGFALYLFQGGGARLVQLVRQRRGFQRLHTLRRYAEESLRLAETRADARAVLTHVATELDLASLRLGEIDIVRAPGGAHGVVLETVACGDGEAVWSRRRDASDDVLHEECATVLCDLLRRADRVLRRAQAPRPPLHAAPEGLPLVQFIACGLDDLRAYAPALRACRERGELRPYVVHTGRRDDLNLGVLAPDARVHAVPDVDLDVTGAREALRAAVAMERYDALLEVVRPRLVVVRGQAGAAATCALAARERGIPVAPFDPDPAALAAALEPLVEAIP